jgi:hypothetical protein
MLSDFPQSMSFCHKAIWQEKEIPADKRRAKGAENIFSEHSALRIHPVILPLKTSKRQLQ